MPINKLEFEGIALLALLLAFAVMAGAIHHYRSELLVVQAQFDAFKQTVEAQGKQAQAEAKLKETINAQAITNATTARDAALDKLRIAQASAGRRSLPGAIAAPAGSRSVCFDATAYNAAHAEFLKRFAAGISATIGLAVEGDAANIDAQALIQGWPK